ncbi:MAG: hypothetical protein NHB15_03145 [Methanosarcina barkeri]|nr:hypothetical protein [Methanosarcina sp. ERenArc_MAG2]
MSNTCQKRVGGICMVKLQKQTRGNYVVAIPKQFLKAQGWSEDEEFALCPCKNGSLRLTPLFKNRA